MDINVKGKTYKISWEYLVVPCLLVLLILVLILSNFSSIRRLWISYSEEISATGDELEHGPEPIEKASPLTSSEHINSSPSKETQGMNKATDNNSTSQPTQEVVQEEVKININTATKDDLISLPYIGEVKALAIIDYRSANGPFGTVEDIVNVKGIGPKTLEKLRPYIKV